jgi:hypothetical protein
MIDSANTASKWERKGQSIGYILLNVLFLSENLKVW